MLLYIFLLLVGFLSLYFLFVYNKKVDEKPKKERKPTGPPKKEIIRVRILYGTTSGTSKEYAQKFYEELEFKKEVKVSIQNLEKFDTEDWESINEKQERLIFFVSTGEKGFFIFILKSSRRTTRLLQKIL
jgi:sulfite reductase alpha subunit-like flavoprotein